MQWQDANRPELSAPGLDALQRRAFDYFLHETNPANGLVADSSKPDATGHKGFYYHFLDRSGDHRAGLCELSTVDTGFLLAGILAAAAFFDHENEQEHEIRTLARSC